VSVTDLAPGAELVVSVDKPAAGGRMIARADGRVVLVSGAIPGERVAIRVDRVGKGVAYATTVAVEDGSPDRVTPSADPSCGGCLYAHIAYERQLSIKAEVIADALARIGRIAWPAAIRVASSRPDGYRMRARLHVRDGRAGFYREESNTLCDARATRQLLPETMDAVDAIVARLVAQGSRPSGTIEVTESAGASERVAHLDLLPRGGHAWPAGELPSGLTGITTSVERPGAEGLVVAAGSPYVKDVLSIEGHAIALRRHVLSFFQANRYLIESLVSHVVGRIQEGARVVDLYAGTGVFAVSASILRGASVTAVEGDRLSAQDLEENSRPAGGKVRPVRQSVETFTRHLAGHGHQAFDVAIVDPPRTGMTRDALAGAIGIGAARVVYVSCDVATLARDARRLLDVGYAIGSVDAFDLFPVTPHVETVVVFDRR
jgi:23S rRNA (uracil1939-C5)-methyltransferase